MRIVCLNDVDCIIQTNQGSAERNVTACPSIHYKIFGTDQSMVESLYDRGSVGIDASLSLSAWDPAQENETIDTR